MQYRIAKTVMLILLAGLPYLPALSGEFIWDDKSIYILDNQLLKAPDGLWRFWLSTDPVDYYPLTYTTFWFEWRCWGTSSTGYHFGNLLCHIGSTLLLWSLLERIGLRWPWIAAAIFAVHPVNVETVAWISQRKSLLAAVFGFASMLAYLHYDKQRKPVFLVWSVSIFALSLAAKPTLIGLPILLPVYEWLRYGRVTRRTVALALPFLAVAVLFGAVGVYFQSHRVLAGDIVRDENLAQRLLSAARALLFYSSKALCPVDLSFVYPRWETRLDTPTAYLPMLFWIAITLLAWRFRHAWGRPFLVALLYYTVTLAPALGFIDVYYWRYSYVADHYQYQSLIAVIGLLVHAAEQCSLKVRADWLARTLSSRPAGSAGRFWDSLPR